MSDSATVLLQYGIAGVAIIAQAFVIIRQYNDNKALQSKFDTLQNDRLQDAKETVDKVSAPLAGISQTMGMIYDKLKSSKEL